MIKTLCPSSSRGHRLRAKFLGSLSFPIPYDSRSYSNMSSISRGSSPLQLLPVHLGIVLASHCCRHTRQALKIKTPRTSRRQNRSCPSKKRVTQPQPIDGATSSLTVRVRQKCSTSSAPNLLLRCSYCHMPVPLLYRRATRHGRWLIFPAVSISVHLIPVEHPAGSTSVQ